MATTLSIKIGPLTAQRQFADDAKAQETLLAFYKAFDLGPDTATNQEKLDAIVNWLAVFVRRKAIQYYIEQTKASAVDTANNLYDLGGVENVE